MGGDDNFQFDVNEFSANVVVKTIESAANNFTSSASQKTKVYLNKLFASYQIGFKDYLNVSYQKARHIKTLLSREKPHSLLDLYVNLSLTCEKKSTTDNDLIADLEKHKHVIVAGLAGTGKSMFMKYLTICRFENPRGKIPLFVELRNINSLTTKKLLEYIYHSCSSAKAEVSYDRFIEGMKFGIFLLILDGFDEVDYEHRDAIAGQILDIAVRYSDNLLVVSSRPDDRFKTWQTFHLFEVEKFKTAQTIELINKIDYDAGVKDRFIKEIKSKLHKTHGSFLSIPLLATMMLLTFHRFAEISPKIHLFYKQAFETLFREHDAQKEQFKRKLRTNLALDDFENCFAAFCVATYLDQKFSFTTDTLLFYAKQAISNRELEISPIDFIGDLKECLCVLQQDGIETTFVHRSFQEYFAALFAARYHGDNVKELISRMARRNSDNVIQMLFEMARQKVEIEWVLPVIEKIDLDIKAASKKGICAQLRIFLNSIESYGAEDKMPGGMSFHANSSLSVLTVLNKLYGNEFPITLGTILNIFDDKKLSAAFLKAGLQNDPRYAALQDGENFKVKLNSDDEAWLKYTELENVMFRITGAIANLKKKIRARTKTTNSLLSTRFLSPAASKAKK